jgi:hypothetical protein
MPVFNTPLEKHQYFYIRGWENDIVLRSYVALGEITPSEYQLITGKPYK